MTRRPGAGREGATERPLSCAAVALALSVAPNTVRHWCREGWLREHATLNPRGHYQIPRRVFEAILAGELVPPAPQRRGSASRAG